MSRKRRIPNEDAATQKGTFPGMDDVRSHLEALRLAHLERLHRLELQAAAFGSHVPPYVLTDLDNAKGELDQLDRKLSPAAPRTLRSPVPDFVGREREIKHFVEILHPASGEGAVAAISGIYGMGGVGKTELAYAVAEHLTSDFPDGQILIELHGTSDTPLSPVVALQTILRAFDRAAHLSDNLTELQETYHRMLRGKHVLIIADDAQDATQVKPLSPPGGCALLITSRQRFLIPGMKPMSVEPLPKDEAAQLLLTICPRIGSSAPALAKLCGYLALALRVSASVLANDATMRLDRYLTRLASERTQMESLRDPDDPELDVAASFELSYLLLNDAEQRALVQLSVFRYNFDLEAAKAIVSLQGIKAKSGTHRAKQEGLTDASSIYQEKSRGRSVPPDVDAVLGALHRRCLLEWDDAMERFRLHDLIRAFAATHLEDFYAISMRYAQHYLDVVWEANTLYQQKKEQMIQGLLLFDNERMHINAAWSWAKLFANKEDDEIDSLLIKYAIATTHITELRHESQLDRIAQFTLALPIVKRLKLYEFETTLLGNLGMTHGHLGNLHEAIKYYEQALAVARKRNDRDAQGTWLINLGNAYHNLGNLQQASIYQEQAKSIFESLNNRRAVGAATGNLAVIYKEQGDLQRALEYYQQDWEIAKDAGDWYSIGQTAGNIGNIHRILGNIQLAIQFHELDLITSRLYGDQNGEAGAFINLGNTSLNGDGSLKASPEQAQKALEYYEQAQTILTITNSSRHICANLLNIGHAHRFLHNKDQALICYEQALKLAEDIGDRQAMALVCWNIGALMEANNNLVKAVDFMQVYVSFLQEIGHPDAVRCAAQRDLILARIQEGDSPAG